MSFEGESESEHIRRVLSRIESFILPQTGDFALSPLSPLPLRAQEQSSLPRQRLEDTLHQLAIADHVRALQVVYRDAADDQCLGRELRGIDLSLFLRERVRERERESVFEKRPTPALLESIVEGRTRALALVRMCFGERCAAAVRARVDLANAYALRGCWTQSETHVVRALQDFLRLSEQEHDAAHIQRQRAALAAARKVAVLFAALRTHAVRHRGQVQRSFLEELNGALCGSDNDSYGDSENNGESEHPAQLLASLHDFLSSATLTQTQTQSKLQLKQLSLQRQQNKSGAQSSPDNEKPAAQSSFSRSWGEVVHFLRTQCDAMRALVEQMHYSLLPQNKAALLLPFRLCDAAQRDLAHPVQLASVLSSFPSAARLVSGSDLAKRLCELRAVVPLVVNANTGSVQNLHLVNSNSSENLFSNSNNTQANAAGEVVPQSVAYELPITLEEFLALYLLHCRRLAVDSGFSILKVQVLTLKGVCSVNISSQLSLAEDVLTQALRELESSGCENDLFAAELYNAIAQMMICKFQSYLQQQKQQFKMEAEQWALHTEDGKKTVRVLAKQIKKQFNFQSAPVGQAEIEYRARATAIKQRTKLIFSHKESETSAMRKNLEAAYRYLAKSFEIIEGAHGPAHPVTGTACLAIASVHNLLRDFENTREWLMKAIRVLEKAPSCSQNMFFPTPFKTITFANVQLAAVLSKLGHDQEGRRVLQKAVDFHFQLAHQSLDALLASKKLIDLDDWQIHSDAQRKQQTTNNTARPPESARSHQSRQSLNSDASVRGMRRRSIDPREKFARNQNAESSSTKDDVRVVRYHDLEQSLYCSSYTLVQPVILKNSSLDEELQLAISLAQDLIKLSVKTGELWEAASQCEQVAKLCEKGFGWDSVETAEAYREMGANCIAVKDWTRAIRALHYSSEAFIALYGKGDSRVSSVLALLSKAKEGKQGLGDAHPQDQQPQHQEPEEHIPEHEESSRSAASSPTPVLSPVPRSPEHKWAEEESAVTAESIPAVNEVAQHIHEAHISASRSASPHKSVRSTDVRKAEVMVKSSQASEEDEGYADSDFYPASPSSPEKRSFPTE